MPRAAARHGLLPAATRTAARRGLARVSRRPPGEVLSGFPRAVVPGGAGRRRAARLAAPAAAAPQHAAPVQLADVLRAAHAKLGQAPAAPLHPAVRSAYRAADPDRAGLCESVPRAHPPRPAPQAAACSSSRSINPSACARAIEWRAPSAKPWPASRPGVARR